MTVLCINQNGWYLHEGNYYGFMRPDCMSETDGPQYAQECIATGMFVDRLGDLCYDIQGFPGHGWDAECFVIAEAEESCNMAVRFIPAHG